MSKRFGRNQKRKLREEAQRYKEALDLQGKLVRHLFNEHDEDVHTLQQVRRVLGEHTALLTPKIEHEAKPPKWRESINLAKFDAHAVNNILNGDQPCQMDLHSQVLWMLNFVEEHDVLTDAVHLGFHWKDGRVGYAISQEAMMCLPEDMLVEQIADSMAKIMISYFKSKGDGRCSKQNQ